MFFEEKNPQNKQTKIMMMIMYLCFCEKKYNFFALIS